MGDGNWVLGYLLPHQPRPPLGEMMRSNPNAQGELDNFTCLADPNLLTACIAKMKDVNALNDVRRKSKGKGKRQEGQ